MRAAQEVSADPMRPGVAAAQVDRARPEDPAVPQDPVATVARVAAAVLALWTAERRGGRAASPVPEVGARPGRPTPRWAMARTTVAPTSPVLVRTPACRILRHHQA